MQHLQPGTTLQSGKYKIERLLGQGGFGITYVGFNTVFDERIAIKEFFMRGVTERDETTSAVSVSNEENVQQFEEQREKFKKEARRLRKLKNEHIVKVHDFFEENGTAYYVMDYIDGENLAERMKRTGKPLSETEVRNILLQLLDSLKEVNQNEVWHLDIKPGNIILDKNGSVCLIDFGASKQIRANGNMTTSTALCYTPGYAPNEQIGQMYERFGPWTDIYALGATIYSLLTGNKPPMSIDIEEDGEDAFSFPTDVSEKMRKMVVWMMQTKRKARPQNIDEIMICHNKQQGSSIKTPNLQNIVDDDKTLILSQLSPELHSFSDTKDTDSQSYLKVSLNQSVVIKNLITNMVLISGGTFTMGAIYEQSNSSLSIENPIHQVTLSSFFLSRYEVTQEEWEAVMGSNPSDHKGSKLPVEQVSWYDCQEFIHKLNAITNKNFRLPTEAEWEYAARGGIKSQGYKYAGSNVIDSVAWYCDNSEKNTHPTGEKSPNELGLYDMSGNVWEWCCDWYGKYNSFSQSNPKGSISGSCRVNRGGSWLNYAECCCVSFRNLNSPCLRSNRLGLRLAL